MAVQDAQFNGIQVHAGDIIGLHNDVLSAIGQHQRRGGQELLEQMRAGELGNYYPLLWPARQPQNRPKRARRTCANFIPIKRSKSSTAANLSIITSFLLNERKRLCHRSKLLPIAMPTLTIRRLVAQLGIEVVPLTIRIGQHNYQEGVNLSTRCLPAQAGAGASSVSVSAPSVAEYAAFLRRIGRATDRIVCIHVSNALNDICRGCARAPPAACSAGSESSCLIRRPLRPVWA